MLNLDKLYGGKTNKTFWSAQSDPFTPLYLTCSEEDAATLEKMGFAAAQLENDFSSTTWEKRQVFLIIPGDAHTPDNGAFVEVLTEFATELDRLRAKVFVIVLPCELDESPLSLTQYLEIAGEVEVRRLIKQAKPGLIKERRSCSLVTTMTDDSDRAYTIAALLKRTLVYRENVGWFIKYGNMWKKAEEKIVTSTIVKAYTSQGWNINSHMSYSFVFKMLPPLLLISDDEIITVVEKNHLYHFIVTCYPKGSDNALSRDVRRRYEEWAELHKVTNLIPQYRFVKELVKIGCEIVTKPDGTPLRPQNYCRLIIPASPLPSMYLTSG